MNKKINVLVAGIGSALLGTEIFKSLKLAGDYNVYVCDISEFAYGHYQPGFVKTFLINHKGYVKSILDLCLKNKIEFVIPGGEEPTILLNRTRLKLEDNGIKFVGNSSGSN